MRIVRWLAAGLLGVLPTLVWADEYTLLGVDAESTAPGGALTAGAAGPASAFYNPAGAIRTKQQATEFNYVWAKPALFIEREPHKATEDYLRKRPVSSDQAAYNIIRYKHSLNQLVEERAERVPLVRGFNLGVLVPLAERPQDARIGLGASVYIPQGPILRQRINAPETPYFVEFDDRSQRISIDTAVAYEITESLRIGGGASVLADIEVDSGVFVPLQINIRDLLNQQSASSAIDVSVTPLATVNVPPVVAPTAGLQWDVVKNRLTLGARYRDEIMAKLRGEASVSVVVGKARPVLLPVKFGADSQFTPRQAAAGAEWRVTDRLTLMGDATWAQWSAYRPPVAAFSIRNIRSLVTAAIVGSGMEDLGILGQEVTLTIPGFPPLPVRIPSREEIESLAPKSITVDYAFKGFRDIVIPRVGVRYAMRDDLSLLGGFFYRPSIEDADGFHIVRRTELDYGSVKVNPASFPNCKVKGGKVTCEEELNQNTLDNDQLGFSAGAVYRYNKAVKFALTGLYVKLVDKTVDKANPPVPTTIDYSEPGKPTLSTAFGYPGYRYGGQVVGGMAKAIFSF